MGDFYNPIKSCLIRVYFKVHQSTTAVEHALNILFNFLDIIMIDEKEIKGGHDCF